MISCSELTPTSTAPFPTGPALGTRPARPNAPLRITGLPQAQARKQAAALGAAGGSYKARVKRVAEIHRAKQVLLKCDQFLEDMQTDDTIHKESLKDVGSHKASISKSLQDGNVKFLTASVALEDTAESNEGL